MSMTGAGLASAVQAAIQALPAEEGSGNIQFIRTDILNAFCTAIVEYIQANAAVASTGTVTSGEGAGGSVTTTGEVS